MSFNSNIHDVNMEQCVLALMATSLSLESIGQELDAECFTQIVINKYTRQS